MKNPWIVMYTSNWKEATDAITTGQALKKYMTLPEVKPVKITNFYSYKIENGNLIDTTNLTREKILKERTDKEQQINLLHPILR